MLLGLLGALGGAGTVLVGLQRGRPNLLRSAPAYGLLVFAGAFLAMAAMERALITRDFTVLFVAENGSSRTPAVFNVATLWSALEGSIILWALVLARVPRRRAPQVPGSTRRPAGGLGHGHHVRHRGVLLRPDGRPGQPLQVASTRRRASTVRGPTRSSRTTSSWRSTRRCSTSATSASPCPSPSPSGPWPPAGWARAGWSRPGAGRCSRGASSPSASCSGPGGPTRCWAGAATGRGTRSRTPRSCPG